eukprot:CAMPEP_0197535462 /NCGR_PEP_ID=MMETSP1318-20131121/50640_1 /TAXON_ID=552666 /ORGANISM="Partenskyella glossopodia, Strain RCC365" /LENGTH=48 /DNA_ID= /DNA_START= /DNA_END= /DNA_ORIENTATION=
MPHTPLYWAAFFRPHILTDDDMGGIPRKYVRMVPMRMWQQGDDFDDTA